MKAIMDTQFINLVSVAFREGDANVGRKQEETENVLLVEQVYRIIAGGDFAALADVLADETALEIIGPPGAPFAGNYQGREQVIETIRRNFSLVEDQRPVILSVVAQGDTVVVVGKESGRFRPTGREYEMHWMHQFTFRDGKLMRIRELYDSAAILNLAEPKENNMSEENRALIDRWFEEVWNKGRAEAVDEMFADDAIAHGLSDDKDHPIRGPESFKVFHRKFRDAFPDITVTVVDTVAEGDKIAARCMVRGTHSGEGLGFAATQKPIEFTGILIARIKDGKVAESWNNFDFLSLYRQLGAIIDPNV